MVLDHLIYNKLKWFNIPDNANNVNVNGKSWYLIPKKVNFNATTPLYIMTNNGWQAWTDKMYLTNAEVEGIDLKNKLYLISGSIQGTTVTTDHSSNLAVPMNDSSVTPVWGGKLALLLARLKACFTARRAVVAC